MDEVEITCDAIVLSYDPADLEAYAGANTAILKEAERISREVSQQILAVIVWDGKIRGDNDLTAAFRDEAKLRAYPIVEITTLSS